MSDQTWRAVSDEVVPECVMALLEVYELAVERVNEAAQDNQLPTMIASIGFASPQASGMLTLALAPKVALATGASENAVRDWSGELANQALGRVKNRLLRYGVELQLATPVVISGERLTVHPGPDEHACFWFATPAGHVDVYVSARVDSDFVWVLGEDEGGEIAPEGDLLMF